MLHLLYILAFTILAVLAVGNLIRNLINLSIESHRPPHPSRWNSIDQVNRIPHFPSAESRPVPHPELFDATGRVIDEPLLIMRSITVEDAREQLDALYEASPSSNSEPSEEA